MSDFDFQKVVAVRIEPARLRDRIEHAEIRRGVHAGARDPLPAQRVAGEVGIELTNASKPYGEAIVYVDDNEEMGFI